MLEIEAKKKFKIAQKNFENKNYKEAQRLWSEIVVYYPKNLSVLRNLSLAYFYDKNLYQSEIYLKKIIEINKKEPNALTMLILVLEDQDKINEAIEYIDLGLKEELLGNDWQIKKELMLPVIFKDLKDIKNSRIKLDKSIDNILKSKIKISLDINSQLIKPVQFALSYDQYDNLKINKKCVELYRKIYPQLNSKYLLKKISSSKIRIGFVSEYLTDHTIGKLFKGIILKLDKNKFDIKIFHHGKTKKGIIYENFFSAEKKGHVKNYILPNNFEEKKKIISEEGLDILFYPEIGLSLEIYYLSFIKLAKYQMTSWGHPETTSNHNIDYFLTSKLIESYGSQKNFSEELLYADYLPMYYYPPIIKNRIDKEDLSKKNIYSCPQTLFKIHPEFDLILEKILQEDKKAKIYFIKDLNNTYYKKLLSRFKNKKNIDLERIKFIDGVSWEEYVNHCGRASVLLDPLYFGSGNSFYESMFYGTPTISKPTNYTKSRLVLGAYNQMKIEKPPITDSIDNYVEQAVSLANDKNLFDLKKYYSEKAKDSLYENKLIISNLEKIFANIVN